ncbi:tetratricopeptide repeat protein [Acanthopleuribacter pedis]|uniref:Tetratricopeptide repeat protein n=1 Tax=Acanthopleuribacter pedis TaxID=442870 RepID=A0A8J7U2T9_9BACT|nr:tetratricopeptide repeat protein [Acanthopleuribacter pedis]MBO1317623.1 tetratricopeptide repeat protein [Acanthopleuribacter pedis]
MPNREEPRQASARETAANAERLRKQGDLEAALQLFDEALRKQPDYLWAEAHRAEVLRALFRFEEAVAGFTRVLASLPDYLWARAHRGAAFYYLRRYDAALDDLNAVIAARADYVWALAYRPHVTIALKRYDEALADVDAFLALDPSLLPNQEGERGMLLNYLGRFEESVPLCDQGLAKDKNDFIAAYTRTVALAQLKGVAAAPIAATRALLQRLRRAGSGDPGLIDYRLGGCAALEGRRDEALACLRSAINLHHEPIETARHDPAWHALHDDAGYRALIAPAEV